MQAAVDRACRVPAGRSRCRTAIQIFCGNNTPPLFGKSHRVWDAAEWFQDAAPFRFRQVQVEASERGRETAAIKRNYSVMGLSALGSRPSGSPQLVNGRRCPASFLRRADNREPIWFVVSLQFSDHRRIFDPSQCTRPVQPIVASRLLRPCRDVVDKIGELPMRRPPLR